MKIKINNELSLARLTKKDIPSLVRYINDIDISNNTLKIPYPYKEKDAEDWINYVDTSTRKMGVLKHWGIKNNKNELIGGIGFHTKYSINSHKDEIGYWLGKPFWNKGIMTQVVKKVCTIGFEEFNLTRIEATVFCSNISSKMVLTKTGFVLEGTLHKYYFKNNHFIDADIYALVK